MYNSDNFNAIAPPRLLIGSAGKSREGDYHGGGKTIVIREDSISTGPGRSYPPRVAITTRIRTTSWLRSIDGGAGRLPVSVQSVLRFIVGGTKATSGRRGQMLTTAGGRENRDFRLPAVLFRGRQTGAREGNPTRPRRLPLAGRQVARGGIDPDTPLWDIELLSFFPRRPTAASSRAASKSVIRRCIQVCKDRALERRVLSRTYEFQRIDQGSPVHRFITVAQRWRARCGDSNLRNGYTDGGAQSVLI